MDKVRREIFFVGIGGQGIRLLSILLAQAYIKKGWYALQSSIYDSAPRSGLTRSEVVAANYEYWYPKTRRPDISIFLEGKYFDWYLDNIKDSLIVVDSTQKEKIENVLRNNPQARDLKIIYHPFIEITRDELGYFRGLNIYVLAYVAAYFNDIDKELLIQVMDERLGKRNRDHNLQALDYGYQAGIKLRQEVKGLWCYLSMIWQ